MQYIYCEGYFLIVTCSRYEYIFYFINIKAWRYSTAGATEAETNVSKTNYLISNCHV